MKKHELIENNIGMNNTFDFTKRIVTNDEGLEIFIYFNPFLIDSIKVSRLMTSLIKIKETITIDTFEERLQNEFISESMIFTKDLSEVVRSIFNGDVAFIVDGLDIMVYMETKSYPSRSISEPDSEKVVRGRRDGFTENFAINIGLIRRRVKTNNLVMKLYEIGDISKTKVVLVYLKDVINKETLDIITKKLDKTNTRIIIESEENIWTF